MCKPTNFMRSSMDKHYTVAIPKKLDELIRERGLDPRTYVIDTFIEAKHSCRPKVNGEEILLGIASALPSSLCIHGKLYYRV